ncbi:MAG: murein L,D-transpeptidase catalytic domain family protein [Gemmatimonadaceae bacterium]|nr:murein L,D-transpeptidase catalytic domain family protein [Gemmatimonadaceae bacterium]
MVAARVRHDPVPAEVLPPAIDAAVFEAASRSAAEHGLHPRLMAIADMSQPSTAQRLYIIDMDARTVVLRTWIAHGQNSGDLTATKFSNRTDSHETSLGLYRVGAKIRSPKHGPALLLDGLDKGVNDKALAREVILHGAKYVSAPFIALHGRLGRSWGCPAVPVGDMARIIELLADGGLLYVYGRPAPQRA